MHCADGDYQLLTIYNKLHPVPLRLHRWGHVSCLLVRFEVHKHRPLTETTVTLCMFWSVREWTGRPIDAQSDLSAQKKPKSDCSSSRRTIRTNQSSHLIFTVQRYWPPLVKHSCWHLLQDVVVNYTLCFLRRALVHGYNNSLVTCLLHVCLAAMKRPILLAL